MATTLENLERKVVQLPQSQLKKFRAASVQEMTDQNYKILKENLRHP